MSPPDMALPKPPADLLPDARAAWWREIAALQVCGPLDADAVAAFAHWCRSSAIVADMRRFEASRGIVAPKFIGAEDHLAALLAQIRAGLAERKAWLRARDAVGQALAAAAAAREAAAAVASESRPAAADRALAASAAPAAPLLPPTPPTPAPQPGPALAWSRPATEAPAKAAPRA